MFLEHISDQYGVVVRINVPFLKQAIIWYEEKLGLKNDRRFFVKDAWAQLNFPNVKRFALGLNVGDPKPSAGNVITFAVNDIEKSRIHLLEEGVPVGEVQEAGQGIKLVFFFDPFGNRLCLRQNPHDHPQAESIGEPQ